MSALVLDYNLVVMVEWCHGRTIFGMFIKSVTIQKLKRNNNFIMSDLSTERPLNHRGLKVIMSESLVPVTKVQ